MDLGPTLFCVLMICLRGARCCDKVNFPCPEIPIMDLTEPPPRTCFQMNDRFRYMCVDGYLRKAGSSGLTWCRPIGSVPQWTPVSLQCIPDPRRTTTQRPNATITTAVLTSRQGTESISASVATETGSTSSGRWSDGSQGFAKATSATAGTSSMIAQLSHNSTDRLHMPELSSTTTTLIVVVSLLIVCALIGVGLVCHRRRPNRSRTQQPMEEQIPMNQAPAAQL
ncbi:interleukin-15 receptor subunit alpha [Brachionichthys hirsutus]|uniref:interleukin-15 receptor subunit alpha n=1 Tax=Brachionichthys hirsutus TaxID=412623 RepID=UPI003604A81B